MSDDSCTNCALGQSRRDFVREAAVTAVGVLLALGISPEMAAAMRPTAITTRRRVGADPSYPIPAADGIQIDKKEQVILVRWKNEVFAFNLSCPHQNTALHWSDADHQFQCPKHHSRYQPDGTFIDGRATRNMDRFSLTKAGNDVVVHIDTMHKSDADKGAWTASVVSVTGAE